MSNKRGPKSNPVEVNINWLNDSSFVLPEKNWNFFWTYENLLPKQKSTAILDVLPWIFCERKTNQDQKKFLSRIRKNFCCAVIRLQCQHSLYSNTHIHHDARDNCAHQHNIHSLSSDMFCARILHVSNLFLPLSQNRLAQRAIASMEEFNNAFQIFPKLIPIPHFMKKVCIDGIGAAN